MAEVAVIYRESSDMAVPPRYPTACPISGNGTLAESGTHSEFMDRGGDVLRPGVAVYIDPNPFLSSGEAER